MPEAPAPMRSLGDDGTTFEITPMNAQPKKHFYSRNKSGGINILPDEVSSNPTVLYYDTDNTCKLITVKLRDDGSVKLGDRLFDFSNSMPAIMTITKNKQKTSYPFFIIKHDNMIPFTPADLQASNPTPDEATRLVDLGTLKTLANIEGAKLKKSVLIILGLMFFFIGFVTRIVLNLTGTWPC
jgi:hypothetical protein